MIKRKVVLKENEYKANDIFVSRKVIEKKIIEEEAFTWAE